MVVHPVLFALHPVLALFMHNHKELYLHDVWTPALILIGAMSLLWLFMYGVSKKNTLSAAGASLTFFFFFSYGHIDRVLETIPDIYVAFLWIALYALSILALTRIARYEKRVASLTMFLHIVGVTLVIPLVMQVAYLQVKSDKQWVLIPPTKDADVVKDSMVNAQRTWPSIYFLVFDRYPSAINLAEEYGYDNSDLIDFLENEEFYVADKSIANYPQTHHSLAATLNMDYIDKLMDDTHEDFLIEGYKPFVELFQDSRVSRTLQKNGYTYYHIGSTWAANSKNWHADVNYEFVSHIPLNGFMYKLFETTLLYPFASGELDIGFHSDENSYSEEARQYRWTLDQMKALKDVPGFAGSKFVFAHFFLPHPPYVFDRNGAYVPKDIADKKDRKTNFVEQLRFTNKQIREIVKEIKKKTKGEAIIIIQADEGPYPDVYEKDVFHYNWEKAGAKELREKYRILNAIYLPDGVVRSALYPSLSPVNTFRIIFDAVFETDFGTLPDKAYVFTRYSHPYDLFEVTDTVKVE